MFGINAQDALLALEDTAIARNVSGAVSSRMEAKNDADVWALAEKRLLERNATIRRLSNELNEVAHRRNATGINGTSAVETLKAVIRDLAAATGQPEEELVRRYNIVRTQQFNREVNRLAEQGALLRDPRTELTEGQKNWYVPGLDPDHGF